jgi:outer membrane protein TolC
MAPASIGRRAVCALALLTAAAAGCAGLDGRAQYRTLSTAAADAERGAAATAAAPLALDAALPLERAALVDAVLRRNPSIAAARHAWRAALARYPQETALEDPMVGYVAGPRSFDSPQIRRAQRIEARQAFPFPGKLALRGSIALAEARAAADDLAATRIRLAALASSLYDEYWLAARAIEINEQHLALVREIHAIALSRYEAGLAEQQDPLRAEVEEAELLHEEVTLRAELRVAAQQLAALLHHPEGADVPAPPVTLESVAAADPLDDGALAAAVEERFELRAAAARIEGRSAAERLAQREFLPDFALSGGYDTFWEIADQRPFVGLEVNVPLAIGRRRAALDEARAELAAARSERDQMRDEIEAELRIARERVAESQHGLTIVRDRVVPAARDQLAAARVGLESGRVALGDVLDAERTLRDAEFAEHMAAARASQRAAEWQAALGRLPVPDLHAIATPATQEGVGHE